MLEIIFEDADLIAINKPHGLLVHKSQIAADASEFALQMLRDQIGKKVYPAHRLDRKTGGILLFSLNKEFDSAIQQLFAEQKIKKTYMAVVRGFTPDQESIDYPLKKENGTLQEAITHFKTLKRFEIPLESGKHLTSRYSLIEVEPETGRMHQIRKHMAHIFHPILGDRPHGCNKQNKIWKNNFEMDTMMLHAIKLEFTHPKSLQKIEIQADLQPEFLRVLNILEPIEEGL